MTSPRAGDSRDRVLALLPRGEAIRNFVYTDALRLTASHVDLAVASVVPNDEIRRLLVEQFGDFDVIEDRPAHRMSGALRDAIDVAHGRWLWSEAAQERWRRRDAEVDERGSRLKHSLRRAGTRPFANRRGLELLDTTYERLARRFEVSDDDRALLERVGPSLVFNASHVHGHAAAPIVAAARALQVTTAAFVFSWDNLTSQGRVIPRYDAFLVWTDDLRTALLRQYPRIDPELVFVTGTPQFDSHFDDRLAWTRSDYCDRLGLDPERPIVLYTTGMPNHMPGEPDIVEELADRMTSLDRQPQLVVRVYAKDRSNRFDDLRARRPDISFPPVAWDANWLTPMPEDTALWSNMLRHADVGVNVASTVSLELCMFDRPVVNIGYNPRSVATSVIDYSRYYRFDHYSPVVASGAVQVAPNVDAALEFVAVALADPASRSNERRALLREFFGDVLDGHAADRVASTLAALARNQHRAAV